jgi:DNA replication licensing factor MCM7
MILTIYLAAFEDFLQTFKTSPQSALANALGDMNIDEDDFSDEYDFMDDDGEEGQTPRRRARAQAKQPKLKYADLLQKVADRFEDEITIDLDDLAKVQPTQRWMAGNR